MKKNIYRLLLVKAIITTSALSIKAQSTVKLLTADPGHFHAALVQKTMYPGVDSTVHVYAPAGNDLQWHLDRISSYNNRKDNPTHWITPVYTGADFFEKMIAEKKGNVVVLSGNNQKKTSYILRALQNGMHVFADKPMVIDQKGFEQLKKAFEAAQKNKLLLYDIMTERYEITTVLQRELSMMPEIFGTLQKVTVENPAITKESVHHFYKYVSGSVLTRPAWFMDVSQQGEGIVDVMTHLVDLVQWECFPDQVIDYKKDISIQKAKRWATGMKLSEFNTITKLNGFPAYFKNKIINDSVLQVYCNGEINYTIKGIHAKTSVIWNYKAPDGTGDTHYSIMKGTKASLIIRQGKEENYTPVLYIEPVNADAAAVEKAFASLEKKYPGIALTAAKNGWTVSIPEKYKEGHESHFARVTEKFLDYLQHRNMPDWEVPNMLAKYYTTTQALALAQKSK